MAVKWQPAEWMQADINYTFADYRYTTFTTDLADFSGNRQPLIPHHKLNVNLTMDIQQWVMVQILASSNSSMWLDDANLVETKPYSEINFLLSSGSKLSKRLTIGLLGNNVFNLTEYSNFRTNAAGQRYYEAASPMHFGVFLKARLF